MGFVQKLNYNPDSQFVLIYLPLLSPYFYCEPANNVFSTICIVYGIYYVLYTYDSFMVLGFLFIFYIKIIYNIYLQLTVSIKPILVSNFHKMK